MKTQTSGARAAIVVIGSLALVTACAPTQTGLGGDAGPGRDGAVSGLDASLAPAPDARTITDAGPGPNWDAFFAADPPPAYCGPDEVEPPPLPGGTPECPDDKNREGCPCSIPNEQAPCWPGMRVDRDRGICTDGVTTCTNFGEFDNRWGPCEGYVLPQPGATLGAAACKCFSAGRWELDNLSPCFITYGGGQTYAVSTYMDTNGDAQCPSSISATPPPAPEPGQPWTRDRLQVDCAGEFTLCYTLKAGAVASPSASDCTVASACVETWYGTENALQELAALPGWTATDAACSGSFVNDGGYGEMSVRGLSIECEAIDDGAGSAFVFHRIGYCPLICNSMPTLPECLNCGNGGSGGF